MAAAKISIADSGIDLDEVNKKRFGVLSDVIAFVSGSQDRRS